MRLRHLLLLLCLTGSATAAGAAQAAPQAGASFVVEDIQVRGLRRISPGAVFIALPVRVGDVLDESRSAEIIRALFQTGFFSAVDLEREGNVLVVVVQERPSIAEINITGNKDIKTEDLLTALRTIDLAPGRIFVPSALDQVQQELQRQYYSQGKYGVDIKTELNDLPRNRVAINITLKEGDVARIKRINIIGNEVYDDDTLRGVFKLSTPNLLSFITGNDKYSRQKLAGDLESLQAYYFDRGYLNFRIDSTQVAITPDKSEMYITINVSEGKQYTVEEVKLSGNLVVAPEEMAQLVTLRPGATFSRRQITRTSDLITARLGDRGYAFANVNAVPEVDEEKARVKVVFFVDPGKRAYVRRISFIGNDKTLDPVMRREMRQMEAASFSAAAVERSRVRLERLGFFEAVNVETPAVPGSNDLVDVNFTVKERASGSISAGVGFGQGSGTLQQSVNETVAANYWEIVIFLNVLMFALAAIGFKSIIAGLMLIVPVNMSNFAIVASLSAANIGLDINTLLVAAVGVGVGIDYGVYLLARMCDEYENLDGDITAIIREAVTTTGRAIAFTATIMLVGILPWWFLSDLKFVAEMGLLLSGIMVINMIMALIILPLLVAFFKPRFLSRDDLPVSEHVDLRAYAYA